MKRILAMASICTALQTFAASETSPWMSESQLLSDPNLQVHVVQQKPSPERGRHELTAYPVTAQVNGRFNQHFGSALSYTYHAHERLAVQLMPLYNWSAGDSSFTRELLSNTRSEASPSSSLLLRWGAVANVEVSPIYGKFAFYNRWMTQFSFVVSAGAGVGSTQHQLKPTNSEGPSTYGDTGTRLLGQVGAGFRVQFGDHFALRLEARDFFFASSLSQVNGCNVQDLQALEQGYEANSGAPLEGRVNVSHSCRATSFDGSKASNLPSALKLLADPSSDILNILGFYAGVSYVF